MIESKIGVRAAVVAVVAGSILMGASSAARAQVPLPIPGLKPPDPPRPPKRGATPASRPDDEGSKTAKRSYPKPAPIEWPSGPSRDLSGTVRVVTFDGIVNVGLGEHVIDAIGTATREGDQLVLIELDTPGGLVSMTERIVQAMLGSRVPIVVHVTPSGARAASAGTLITMAAHVAAMAPATRIGAAHPVFGMQDPEEVAGKHMAAKVENDLVALAVGIAETRHRNQAWAEDAVRRSVSATAEEAARLAVVDLVVKDRPALFAALEGRPVLLNGEKVILHPQSASIVVHPQSLRQRLLNLIATPGVASLLLVLGFIGVMVEVYQPGMVAPGVMGVLCLVCAYMATEQLPIDVGAGLLLLAGLGLLVAELYTPTFGALGFLGLLGVAFGMTLLVDPSDTDFAIDPSIRLTMWDVLPIAALLGGFVAYLSYFLATTQRARSVTGLEGMIGARGRVLKPVDGSGGQVFVAGEYWRATSVEPLDVDTPVRVVRVDSLCLEVRREVEDGSSEEHQRQNRGRP